MIMLIGSVIHRIFTIHRLYIEYIKGALRGACAGGSNGEQAAPKAACPPYGAGGLRLPTRPPARRLLTTNVLYTDP